MKEYNSNEKIEEIKKRLDEGLMSVLVGSGFSKNAHFTFPNWDELLEPMIIVDIYVDEYNDYLSKEKSKETKEQLTEEELKSNFVKKIVKKIGYLEIVEEYIKLKGYREALTIYIEESFKKAQLNFDKEVEKVNIGINNRDLKQTEIDLSLKEEKLETHIELLKLNWNNVYTTNYDKLLEEAAELDSDLKYEIVTNSSDLNVKLRNRIIKLHGSLRKDSKEVFGFDNDLDKQYVISKEDYETYPKKHEAFMSLIKLALLQESFCLIGFSGNDPNFINWMKWVRDVLKPKGTDEKLGKIFLIDLNDEELEPSKELHYKNLGIERVSLFEAYTEARFKSKEGKEGLDYKKALKLFFNEINTDTTKNNSSKVTEGKEETIFDEIINHLKKENEELILDGKFKEKLKMEFIIPDYGVLSDIKHCFRSKIGKMKEYAEDEKLDTLKNLEDYLLILEVLPLDLSYFFEETTIKKLEKKILTNRRLLLKRRGTILKAIFKFYRKRSNVDYFLELEKKLNENEKKELGSSLYFEKVLIKYYNFDFKNLKSIFSKWDSLELTFKETLQKENLKNIINEVFKLGIKVEKNEKIFKEENLIKLNTKFSKKTFIALESIYLAKNDSYKYDRDKRIKKMEELNVLEEKDIAEKLKGYYKPKIEKDYSRGLSYSFGGNRYTREEGIEALFDVLLLQGIPLKIKNIALLGNEINKGIKVENFNWNNNKWLRNNIILGSLQLESQFGNSPSYTIGESIAYNASIPIEDKEKIFKVFDYLNINNFTKVVQFIAPFTEIMTEDRYYKKLLKYFEEENSKLIYDERFSAGRGIEKIISNINNKEVLGKILDKVLIQYERNYRVNYIYKILAKYPDFFNKLEIYMVFLEANFNRDLFEFLIDISFYSKSRKNVFLEKIKNIGAVNTKDIDELKYYFFIINVSDTLDDGLREKFMKCFTSKIKEIPTLINYINFDINLLHLDNKLLNSLKIDELKKLKLIFNQKIDKLGDKKGIPMSHNAVENLINIKSFYILVQKKSIKQEIKDLLDEEIEMLSEKLKNNFNLTIWNNDSNDYYMYINHLREEFIFSGEFKVVELRSFITRIALKDKIRLEESLEVLCNMISVVLAEKNESIEKHIETLKKVEQELLLLIESYLGSFERLESIKENVVDRTILLISTLLKEQFKLKNEIVKKGIIHGRNSKYKSVKKI